MNQNFIDFNQKVYLDIDHNHLDFDQNISDFDQRL